jgi:hypothetical protein
MPLAMASRSIFGSLDDGIPPESVLLQQEVQRLKLDVFRQEFAPSHYGTQMLTPGTEKTKKKRML